LLILNTGVGESGTAAEVTIKIKSDPNKGMQYNYEVSEHVIVF